MSAIDYLIVIVAGFSLPFVLFGLFLLQDIIRNEIRYRKDNGVKDA